MAIDGDWKITVKSPMGVQNGVLSLKVDGETVTGTAQSPLGSATVEEGKFAGDKLTFVTNITTPMALKLEYDITVSGDNMTGNVKAGAFGNSPLNGSRA